MSRRLGRGLALSILIAVLLGVIWSLVGHRPNVGLPTRALDIEGPVELSALVDASVSAVYGRARARWEGIEDYHCTIRSLNWLVDREDQSVLDVTFRKPHSFRHELIEGASRGVVLCYDGEQVRARPGGVLGLMTVQMKLSDPRLLDGRGEPFFKSDWGSELDRFADAIADGAVGSVDATVKIGDDACWALKADRRSDDAHDLEIWIDQRTDLPRRCVTRRQGRVLRDATYESVDVDRRPGDERFVEP